MLKNIFFTCSLIFSFAHAQSQTIDIGRATVTLPADGEWVEVGQNNTGTSYGGDVSGTTDAESKTYALLNLNKEWMALITIRASKSTVGNATISWTGGCKGSARQAVYDFTNGSPVRNDCLKVFKSIKSDTYISHDSMKTIKAGLDSKNITLIGSAYLVTHMVGTSSGTFVSTSAVISHNALKKTLGSNVGEEFAGQPGVAWGHLMAEQSRDSANSIRGRMSVPSFK